MLAALLPTFATTIAPPGYLLVPALAGYALILWSMVTLGPRFGIAPADRGLTRQGPYRRLRHPMYLGELVFRVAMVFSSPDLIFASSIALVLVVIQCWRIRREEKLLEGYPGYALSVPWRLIPGVW
jgi:protein-S-isoprenylcysteine O-methyltransferase Ste14